MSYSFQDIFNKWAKPIANDKIMRFTQEPREELLDDLAVALKAHNIDYDEAKSRKSTVIKFMTTEEGRKGIGKYKDWVPKVEEQYLNALAFYYIEDRKLPNLEVKEVTKQDLYEQHKTITAWSKHRFGEFWTEDIDKECHQKGSYLNMLFQKEVFDTEKVPQYILDSIYRS